MKQQEQQEQGQAVVQLLQQAREQHTLPLGAQRGDQT